MNEEEQRMEIFASRILIAAMRENRAAELLDCLFNGGSATVDRQGKLTLASADVIAQLMGKA